MSPSALHAHFRAVAGVSRIQYQKRLRLEEARRLLLADATSAEAVAYEVGYARVAVQPGVRAAVRGAATTRCGAPARRRLARR
jgi:methylphosphotriester-DNA--protein-cysteine methyltransferase